MNPDLGISCLECVEGTLVEAMVTFSALTSKMELGMFLPFPFLNCALDWKWQFSHQTGHVRFDLIQMFFAKMLNSVSHGKRLEY